MVCSAAVGALRVEFEGLGKRFGRLKVLSGIAGRLEPGRVVVVSGPNGSGKSTLLNVLAGLTRPSTGSVRYLDGDTEVPRRSWFAAKTCS